MPKPTELHHKQFSMLSISALKTTHVASLFGSFGIKNPQNPFKTIQKFQGFSW